MSNEINNNGFCIAKCNLTEEDISKIKKDLYVKPETTNNFYVKSFKVYKETKNYFILPIYYVLLNFTKFNDSHVNFTTNIPVNIKSEIKLRPEQIECYNVCFAEFSKEYGGGVINLSTASGKTVLSLKLIAESKKKALIIVDKVEMMSQWCKEINKWFPDIRIGKIQGTTFEFEDYDIVVGMLQTISLKKELKSIDFNWVDLCFIDEIHGVSSEVFSRTLFKVRPKFIFGLTATLERKDKLEKIIKWCIGDIIYSNIDSDLKQNTEIHVYKNEPINKIVHRLQNGDIAVAKMLNSIANDNTRNDLIINILKQLILEKDRNILVVSDRIVQLKYIHAELNEHAGLFIGGMKSEDMDKSKTKQILLGTYPLVKQGFNHPKLNCILFATPRSSITQAIGRIYRKKHDISPIIVDIVDSISPFNGQYYRRRKVYNQSINKPIYINKSTIHDNDDIVSDNQETVYYLLSDSES